MTSRDDYQIRVFTTEQGQKIYAFIDLSHGGYTVDEIMREIARFKHDKLDTKYTYNIGYINRYTDDLDGLWFYSWDTDYDYIPCIAFWEGCNFCTHYFYGRCKKFNVTWDKDLMGCEFYEKG